MASYFFVRCYSSFFLGTTHSESIFPWPSFDLPRMSHKDFLTPVTCVKMLGPGNILGIFWVDFWVPHKTSNMGDILGIISGRIRQVTRPRLEEKKTGQTPSISPVFGQRHPESEQNSVKFSTKGFACSHLWFRNRSERQILEAKKKSHFLWLTFLCQTFLHRLHQILWKNVQCQTFWEAWLLDAISGWVLKKLDGQLEFHPKRKQASRQSVKITMCLEMSAKKIKVVKVFSSKPTQYCRVVFIWFYYP